MELAAAANCDPALLAQQLERDLGIAFFTSERLLAATPDFTSIRFTECRARAIFPVGRAGAPVFVVTDPWNDAALQWLASRTGNYPDLGWSTPDAIAAALDLVNSPSEDKNRATGTDGQEPACISPASIEHSASEVVRFVDAAIYEAWKAGASDIHFECGREGVWVKQRLDGVLVPAAALPNLQLAEEVISRIKVLAQLDIAERRVPQDGRFRLRIDTHELDFRVSIMPSIFGEDAVLRLLDKSHLGSKAGRITLASLGLEQDAIDQIRRLAHRPHGMLLVTGPTGSGKTTTLYAALSEIHTGQEKIITIEDPVEYGLDGILQIPVNDKKGLTFSQGLRSILRHDPDKILVGEIRDAETAEIAVQAALTGHLVFTTVHANSLFDVIGRFIHMQIDLYSFMSALSGVVAQRLLRCVCSTCATPDAGTSQLRTRIEELGLPAATLRPLRAVGCGQCRHTGYKGRIAIAEVLAVDDKLRTLVLSRATIAEIKQHTRALGIRPLRQRALALAASGVTTLDEIERVIAHD